MIIRVERQKSFHWQGERRYISVLMCPCCVQLLSYWGHSLPSSYIAVWDNNLNTCRISLLFFTFSLRASLLLSLFVIPFHPHILPPSLPPCSPRYPHSLMVTLLSDCYISSHGKSAVSPVSYHYANDGQFNFSWSEGEFLIRVRHSTQDGEKDVKAKRGGRQGGAGNG